MENIEDYDNHNDMEVVDDISFMDILNTLLEKDNLELKTHIFRPKQLAVLNIVADLLETYNLPKSSAIIIKFIDLYLTYMVSYNRESRKEIIKALTHQIDDNINKNKSISDKLD